MRALIACFALLASFSFSPFAFAQKPGTAPARCIVSAGAWCIAVGWPMKLQDDGSNPRIWTVNVGQAGAAAPLTIIDTKGCSADTKIAARKTDDTSNTLSDGSIQRTVRFALFGGCDLEFRYKLVPSDQTDENDQFIKRAVLVGGHQLIDFGG
jgi:hypothetical protein